MANYKEICIEKNDKNNKNNRNMRNEDTAAAGNTTRFSFKVD